MSPEAPTTPPKPAFEPYIPASSNLSEFRAVPLIVGTLLGVIFGASSLYLALKVGLTVSASIPVAVISIALFRLWSKFGGRDATILENNIVQTAGSAGESLAFGVGLTMPPMLILGFDLEITRVMLVSVLGGLLGILMMIPLRRALIVQQHGKLKYPEGTACAEVLKAGASEESRVAAARGNPVSKLAATAMLGAKTIFVGFAIGIVYQILLKACHLWKEVPERLFGDKYKGGSVSCEATPELLGVGYVIGPRIGAVMLAGGVLAYLLLIPLIKFFGDGLAGPLAPGTKLIKDMSPGEVRGAYLLYIGAGAVATGGLISLCRSLPLIWRGISGSMRDFRGPKSAAPVDVPRTDRDLPLKFVFIGILALIIAILAVPSLHMNFVGAIMIILCGFLFVTVSSRLTGEIGSSSNPISGMTIATLILTCLAFLALGWTDRGYYLTALSVGGIVCIASSNGGTTSQDLKSGYLVGATPRYQQIAILVGALASAIALGPLLLLLNDTGTVYAKVAPALHAEATALTGEKQTLPKESADSFKDQNAYFAVPLTDPATGKPRQYLVDATGKAVYTADAGPNGTIYTKVAPEIRIDAKELKGAKQTLPAEDAKVFSDNAAYYAAHVEDKATGDFKQYLFDDTGKAAYLIDPGINGTLDKRANGNEAKKFSAPKATLVSYIIKGILGQNLPWVLVLFGVMIALVLELCGIPSLAFAVGVYLPISTSVPVFIGGVVRWLVDGNRRKKAEFAHLTEEEHVAEGDKSPGVLMASGYIAGGAIAGIIIAIAAYFSPETDAALAKWSEHHNMFVTTFKGYPSADLLSIIPFAVIVVVLYLTGRGKILAGRKV